MSDLNQTLKELRNEDIIWIINLFIASFAILSNSFERDYLLSKNLRSKKRFKTINITIGAISFFIFLYFFLLSYSRCQKNRKTSMKDFCLQNANLVAASLVLIASIIYFFTEILSDDDFEANILI